MVHREPNMIAAYHDILVRLWDAALDLHRCSGCAARDLESRLRVFSEEICSNNLSPSCAGVCEDARAFARPLYRARRLGKRRGFEAGGFGRVELVSNLLCEAWSLGKALMICPACVEAAILYDIRTAAAEAQHARTSRKAGSVPGGCARCCAAPVGLV